MHRRLFLTSAGLLVASQALAQTNPSPAPASPTPEPASPSPSPTPTEAANPPANGSAPNMSDAMKKYMQDTLAVGSLSLLISRYALPKSGTLHMKQFAQFEIAEQETIATIFKAVQSGNSPVSKVQPPSDDEAMNNVDAEGKQLLKRMREMRAGGELDREYVHAELDGHHKLLQIQDDYLKSADNAQASDVALLAKGMIEQHIVLLENMEKGI